MNRVVVVLGLILILCPLGALAAGDEPLVVTMRPGDERTLRPPEVVRVGLGKSRQGLGAKRRTQSVLSTALLDTAGNKPQHLEARVVGAKRDSVQIVSSPEAAVGEYRLHVEIEKRVETFQEVVDTEYDAKTRKRRDKTEKKWVETECTTSTHEYPVWIELELPELIVPPHESVILDMPIAVTGVRIEDLEKKCVVAEVNAVGQIRLTGRENGRATFKVQYRIGSREFTNKLLVRVPAKPPAIDVTVQTGGGTKVRIDKLDKAAKLHGGKILAISAAMPDSIVRAGYDGFAIELHGQQPGFATIAVVHEGFAKKSLSGKRIRAVVTLRVSVADPEG